MAPGEHVLLVAGEHVPGDDDKLAGDGHRRDVRSTPLAARVGDQNWMHYDGMLVSVESYPLLVVEARSLGEPILSVIRDGDDVWPRIYGRVVSPPGEAHT